MDRSRRKSRLRPSIQQELFRQFVAGVPACMAAELTGMSRNTAILLFRKLRELNPAKLAEAAPFVDGEIKADESFLAGFTRVSAVEVQPGRYPCSGCSSAVARCMP